MSDLLGIGLYTPTEAGRLLAVASFFKANI